MLFKIYGGRFSFLDSSCFKFTIQTGHLDYQKNKNQELTEFSSIGLPQNFPTVTCPC